MLVNCLARHGDRETILFGQSAFRPGGLSRFNHSEGETAISVLMNRVDLSRLGTRHHYTLAIIRFGRNHPETIPLLKVIFNPFHLRLPQT